MIYNIEMNMSCMGYTNFYSFMWWKVCYVSFDIFSMYTLKFKIASLKNTVIYQIMFTLHKNKQPLVN